MIHLAKRTSEYAKGRFGSYSRVYRVGAKLFHLLRSLLDKLGFSPLRLYDDLELVARVTGQSALTPPEAKGKNIVFYTTRGWSLHVFLETLLASRLRAEGHKVRFVSCHDSLPVCAYGSINFPERQRRNCNECMATKAASFSRQFETTYLPSLNRYPDDFRDRVRKLDLQDCLDFEYDGVPYGPLVRPGVVWYLRRSRLNENDAPLFREALCTAHVVRKGIEGVIASANVDAVVMLNGDFVSEKTAAAVLAAHQIRFLTHDFTIEGLLAVAENRSIWDDLTFDLSSREQAPEVSPADVEAAETLLLSWRRKGGYQGELFWSASGLTENKDLREQLHLTQAPLAVAYTNLTFESSVMNKDRMFNDQFHWLQDLVSFFGSHPEFQMVVRVHPAEVRDSDWRPNESLYSFLLEEMGTMPANIRVIGPHEDVSSYLLGTLANAVLVYSSTIGLELAERNMAVITAANVHYGGRGFTIDPATREEYFEAISSCLRDECSAPGEQRSLVVKYVAWLFGSRLTPIEALSPREEGWPQVNVSRISDLYLPTQGGINRVADLISGRGPWW